MELVSLADAKANLSKIIDKVEAGSVVDITRRGRPVARLIGLGAVRKPVAIAELRALTDAMPAQKVGAAELVRAMRDDDRA